MNITVYLGANAGNDEKYERAIRALGDWIGQAGHTLVYGGSNCGLMGTLARTVLASGGRVIGVEPRFFVEEGLLLDGLTEFYVTENMSQRKAKMIELGDAFIAFPGGTGTLEEISEVMSNTALRLTSAPCIIYNLDGFYDPLRALLDRMLAEGFSTRQKQKDLLFASSLDEIRAILGS